MHIDWIKILWRFESRGQVRLRKFLWLMISQNEWDQLYINFRNRQKILRRTIYDDSKFYHSYKNFSRFFHAYAIIVLLWYPVAPTHFVDGTWVFLVCMRVCFFGKKVKNMFWALWPVCQIISDRGYSCLQVNINVSKL